MSTNKKKLRRTRYISWWTIDVLTLKLESELSNLDVNIMFQRIIEIMNQWIKTEDINQQAKKPINGMKWRHWTEHGTTSPCCRDSCKQKWGKLQKYEKSY